MAGTTASIGSVASVPGSARERIASTAYDLFLERGVRAVGINEIISRAGVAKATFYSHFPSKDSLVLEFFERRQSVFTIGYLGAEFERRCTTPRDQLLAIFDIFDDWFHMPDFTGCPYIRALIESGSGSVIGAASLAYLRDIRAEVESAAVAMELADPEELADCWMLLMQGAIVAALGTDRNAAVRARDLGTLLLDTRASACVPAAH